MYIQSCVVNVLDDALPLGECIQENHSKLCRIYMYREELVVWIEHRRGYVMIFGCFMTVVYETDI